MAAYKDRIDRLNMLAKLIYASEASAPMGVGDIEGILKTARRKNRLLDLTGTLLFDRQFFLQVIEGDPQQIQKPPASWHSTTA